jgi:hypothetical protein
MRWPTSRRRPVIVKGHTAYFARQSANRNVVLYWHKRSKITGEPCVRIDIRLRQRAIRSHQLGSVEAMLACIPAAVINHNLRIADGDGNLIPLPDLLIPDRLTWPVTANSMVNRTRSPLDPTQVRAAGQHLAGRQLWHANRPSSHIAPPILLRRRPSTAPATLPRRPVASPVHTGIS